MAASCRAVLPNYEETGMVLPFEHHFLPIHFNFAIKEYIDTQSNKPNQKQRQKEKNSSIERIFSQSSHLLLPHSYPGALLGSLILHVNIICKNRQPIALRYKTVRWDTLTRRITNWKQNN